MCMKISEENIQYATRKLQRDGRVVFGIEHQHLHSGLDIQRLITALRFYAEEKLGRPIFADTTQPAPNEAVQLIFTVAATTKDRMKKYFQ